MFINRREAHRDACKVKFRYISCHQKLCHYLDLKDYFWVRWFLALHRKIITSLDYKKGDAMVCVCWDWRSRVRSEQWEKELVLICIEVICYQNGSIIFYVETSPKKKSLYTVGYFTYLTKGPSDKGDKNFLHFY